MSRIILRLFLFLSGIEGLFVVNNILQSPSETASALLWGLSASRLLMLGGTLLLVFLSFGAIFFSFWRRISFERFERRLEDVFRSRKSLFVGLSICSLVAYAGGQLALIAPTIDEPVVSAFLLRLQPFFIWIALICVQSSAVILIWHSGSNSLRPSKNGLTFQSIVMFNLLVFGWIWVINAGYGFAEETKSTGYFRGPGTPIINFQIILALGITFGFYWLWNKLVEKDTKIGNFVDNRLDLIIGIVLWVATFSLWMAVPLKPSWFADQPRTPNYTFSPNSDALMYDSIGQSLIVGSGFSHPHWGDAIRRPMLAGVIGLFHVIRGLGYEEIIVLQVALLAFFPVLIYFFTSTLHTRISGLLAAILIIFRERNAIVLADTITVSHAKILMSDLPAAIGVVFFLYLTYRWLKNPVERQHFPFVAGGVIGFFVLVRSEIGFLIPIMGIAGLWLLRGKPMVWAKGIALLSIGFLLMVGPWMWRNWRVTGNIYLDTPTNINRVERIFEFLLDREDIFEQSSNNNIGYKDAVLIPEQQIENGGQESGLFSQSEEEDFDKIENFLNHFINGQTQYFYTIPLSPQMLSAIAHLAADRSINGFLESCCSVENYVRDLPYWWGSWDGGLDNRSYISMTIALVIFSFGIVILWKKNKILGVLPLFAGSFHVMFFAFNRRSGGRWIMEYDWFSFIILSVGLVVVIQGIGNSLRTGSPQIESRFEGDLVYGSKTSWSMGHYLTVAFLLFFLGASLPMSEILIPQRYSESEMISRIEALLGSEQSILSAEEKIELENLINQDVAIWFGRALYPRYFDQFDGIDGWKDHYKHRFSRYEFYNVGTINGWSLLPYVGDSVDFPHATDVLSFGCGRSYYNNAIVMVLYPAGSDYPYDVLWQVPTEGESEDCFSE